MQGELLLTKFAYQRNLKSVSSILCLRLRQFAYTSNSFQVTGENPVPGIETFEESGLRNLLLDNIKRSGYKTPTPIQKRTLPIVMAGRDLMGCAQTGSGKTAAFLLPVLHK